MQRRLSLRVKILPTYQALLIPELQRLLDSLLVHQTHPSLPVLLRHLISPGFRIATYWFWNYEHPIPVSPFRLSINPIILVYEYAIVTVPPV